jgi:3D-(3,5/4)-trihydroxycyclohexane-1,2-dione acylhydrolase (decyclizing)
MKTVRLTMAQAIIRFLKNQYVERDGVSQQFFGGVFGIFGHGNVAGIGQALQENPDFPYFQSKNEQAQVHAAAAYARMKNRLGAMVCTSSIGPGATNMITGAAAATINRIPVLLLPGDVFARRNVSPVLQQIESESSQDVSVNDCFKPVSRYWDRLFRPEQILTALPEAMRVLTSPAQTGAVTLCLPQDVQAEAYDYPEAFFDKRTWRPGRQRPDQGFVDEAVAAIKASVHPVIIAGGGVIYSDACAALSAFCRETGIPVGETQAGKGALRWDHPQSLGGIGATGTAAANIAARDADLVIGIGTRYSDFTTSSKTQFANPDVRFININVTEFDAAKHNGLMLVGDARVTIDAIAHNLKGWHVQDSWAKAASQNKALWDAEVERIYHLGHGPLPSQGEIIGALDEFLSDRDVIINAAGSAPGDLHKLWRTRDEKQYHMEYGYSTMGYEIPAAIGVKMAAPDRDVYALIGDGTFLMMPSDIVTAVQEQIKVTYILIDNHGFASIGGLSQSLGSGGFGTRYRVRTDAGLEDGEFLPIDFAAICRGFGAHTVKVGGVAEFAAALVQTRKVKGPVVIVVETDREARVGGYESWWDVAVAEVSTMDQVRAARSKYEVMVGKERNFFTE